MRRFQNDWNLIWFQNDWNLKWFQNDWIPKWLELKSVRRRWLTKLILWPRDKMISWSKMIIQNILAGVDPTHVCFRVRRLFWVSVTQMQEWFVSFKSYYFDRLINFHIILHAKRYFLFSMFSIILPRYLVKYKSKETLQWM